MKRLILVLLIGALVVIQAYSYSEDPNPLNLKGFYLGMEKNEVNELYLKIKSDQVAKYISIEPSQYRDLIKLENEFSSMGNKIELNYDENGKVVYIKFQYTTVDILFDAKALSAEEYVQKIKEEYDIPEMEFKDMGMVKTWTYSDEKRKFSLSIDDYKNTTVKPL
jgi:hypothetical protein